MTVSLGREIYPNLKLRIYTSGIRQNRLAKMLGIDEAHLSRIINGFRRPSGDIREHLATILQSDPEWLFHSMQITDPTITTEVQPQVVQPQVKV
jgi:transcriptional regulator with XRE-family HTH domain